MSVMSVLATKRHRKHVKQYKSAKKPGSEAYWNPDMKKRAKAVKSVVKILRDKREMIENKLESIEEDQAQVSDRKKKFSNIMQQLR